MLGDLPSALRARIAITIGLAGCAAGLLSAMWGVGGLAIVAGIAALVGPLVMADSDVATEGPTRLPGDVAVGTDQAPGVRGAGHPRPSSAVTTSTSPCNSA